MYGVVLGGWSSGSKYSLLGALRGGAQVVSYELVLGLALVGVALVSGTLSIGQIVQGQANLVPYVFLQPLGFLLYFTAAVAETNRAPFDLPEAEQELVAGYHTEYSGFRFAMYFIAEYINLITVSAIASTLFFGGWIGPIFSGPVVAADQDGRLRLHLRLAASDPAAPALRPAHAAVLGRAAAARPAQRAGHRRAGGGPLQLGSPLMLDGTRAFVRGLVEVLRHGTQPAITISYPEVKRQLPPTFRGRHRLYRHEDGLERCIGCELCARPARRARSTCRRRTTRPSSRSRPASATRRSTRST